MKKKKKRPEATNNTNRFARHRMLGVKNWIETKKL